MITWHQPDQLTLVSRPRTSAADLALGPALPWTSIYVLTQTLHNFFKSSKITWIGQRPGHGAQDRIELDGNVTAPGTMTHPWTKFTSCRNLRFGISNFLLLLLAPNSNPEKEEYDKNKNHNKRTLGSFILTSRNLLSVAKIFVFVRTRFYDASSEMRKSGNAENFPPRIWILEKLEREEG